MAAPQKQPIKLHQLSDSEYNLVMRMRAASLKEQNEEYRKEQARKMAQERQAMQPQSIPLPRAVPGQVQQPLPRQVPLPLPRQVPQPWSGQVPQPWSGQVPQPRPGQVPLPRRVEHPRPVSQHRQAEPSSSELDSRLNQIDGDAKFALQLVDEDLARQLNDEELAHQLSAQLDAIDLLGLFLDE